MDRIILNNKGINELCKMAEEYLISSEIDRKDAIRTRLTVEETLLKYQSVFGNNCEASYKFAKIFGQRRIIIQIEGSEFNPFEIASENEDFLMDTLLQSYDSKLPNWKYRNNVNQIVFNVLKTQKHSMLQKLLIAIIAGTALGLASKLLPGGIGAYIAESYLTPLSSAFVGLFCVMAVFLTFFAVSLGIVHAGDLSTLSELGKNMMGRIGKIMIAVTLAVTACLIPIMSFEGGIGDLKFKSAYDLIIGFIPSNPISPLVDFNTAQIIIVGALFGFAMLILGSKTSTLEAVFTEGNIIAVNVNSFLNSRLIHYYVGVNFFILAATASVGSLLSSVMIIVIVLAAFAVLMFLYTIAAARTLGCKMSVFIKKLMPTFMINLSSASYGSSFTQSIETLFACGTDIDYGAIGHNVGGLLFKPAYAILLSVGTIVSAVQAGVTFNFGYIITIILLTIILSMSLPTIPGAAISGFTLMFAQLGLPQSSLAIVVTLNALLDFFTVATNGYCLQSEIMIGAKKVNRIDTTQF